MNREYFISRVALKVYAKSIFGVAAVLILILSYLTNMTIETNRRELRGTLEKRNSTLRNRLGNDIADSLKWISVYMEIGILDDIFEGKMENNPLRTVIGKIAQSNGNVNEIVIFNLKGETVKRHYLNERNREPLSFPLELEEDVLSKVGKNIFIDAKAHSQKEIDFYFYVPIIGDDEKKGYVGISYGLDSFFNQFKEEFKGIFDTKNLGVVHRDEVNSSNFFSVDLEGEQVDELINSKVKASTSFDIGGQFKEKLSPYFNKVVLSSGFSTDGMLTSYSPAEIVGVEDVHSVRKYFIFIGAVFIILMILLWMYIQERIEKIVHFKKLKIYNVKLRKTLETKDMLFSIIGHDLRSPFTSQLGYVQLLQRKFDTYEKKDIKTIIDVMSVNSEKLSILTENILRWAAIHNKKIEYRPENLRLKDIIEEYEDIFKVQLANKNIDLEVDIMESPIVRSDKNLLEASIRNLISNAIKYSKKDGSIKIQAKEEKEYISLSIEDEGTGIPKDIKPYVLKGSQVSTAGTYNEKGIGLGLYIVREFTKLNKGKVSFESEEGKGTKFTLLIPRG